MRTSTSATDDASAAALAGGAAAVGRVRGTLAPPERADGRGPHGAESGRAVVPRNRAPTIPRGAARDGDARFGEAPGLSGSAAPSRARALAAAVRASAGAARSGGAWALRGLLDALLPPHCLLCEEAVDAQGSLCAGCFSGLSFVTEPCCARCGVPFPRAAAAGKGAACPSCAERPPAFEAARAALRYDAGSQRLILPFKHGDRTELAAPLARHMARAGAALLARTDLLAPVPLHPRRLLARRYNQAALLAARLARGAGKPHLPDLLRRRRATPPLGEAAAAERASLVSGVFSVPRRGAARAAGRRVLLVDDVLTSGATAGACAEALLAAGAAAVDVLAAARVPDPRLEAARRRGPSSGSGGA